MILILPTASSNSFRSRSASRTYDSASDVAFRNAALCVISSPPGGLACFARVLAAAFFFDGAALDDGLRFFILVAVGDCSESRLSNRMGSPQRQTTGKSSVNSATRHRSLVTCHYS